MKTDTLLTLVVAFALLAISSVFGAYLYHQVDEYYDDKMAVYAGYNSPLEFDAPRASKGFTEDGRWVRILYPNDTKTIEMGQSYSVYWEYKNVDKFRLYLQHKDKPEELLDIVGVVYQGEPPAEDTRRGVYNWNAGQLSEGEYVDSGSGWKLVVADAEDPENVFDFSDSYFSLIKKTGE